MMNTEKNLAKRMMCLLLAAGVAIGLTACQKPQHSDDPKQSSTAQPGTSATQPGTTTAPLSLTAAEIEQKIAEAIGADQYLCTVDIEKETLETYYGLDGSQIEDFCAKQNAISSVNPDTVIVLKLKRGYADTAVEKLNTGYAQLVGYIRMYPFGTAKVLNARLCQIDDYVLYIIAGASYDGEDAEEEAKFAEAEYAKIDAALSEICGKLPENRAIVPESSGNESGGLIIGG